jgi:erythromycin esterase
VGRDICHTTSGPALETMASMTASDVHRWIAEHGVTLRSTDLHAPPPDLDALRDVVGDAVVVGVGASTYGAHEHFALTCRIIRFLVEELGFRSVATEDDWDKGLELNRYVQTGEGSLAELMADAGVPWRTREVVALLEWLRAFNVEHRDDPAQFVGVGVIDTRAPVYEAIEGYVGRVDPERLPALREHFAAIRPTRPDHWRWFFTEAPDKPGMLEHARRAEALVEQVPHDDADPEYALIGQHARQITATYEHYVEHVVDDGYRDRQMAETLRWWQDHTGHRIAYWSTNAHSARSPELFIATPPRGALTFTPTGEHLRRTYGDRYVSIGLSFDSGTVNSGWALPPFQPRPIPAGEVPDEFAERALAGLPAEHVLVPLPADGGTPPAVAEWLRRPAKTRVIGSVCAPDEPAEGYYFTGGSLADWYDAIVHSRRVTPSEVLP